MITVTKLMTLKFKNFTMFALSCDCSCNVTFLAVQQKGSWAGQDLVRCATDQHFVRGELAKAKGLWPSLVFSCRPGVESEPYTKVGLPPPPKKKPHWA